MLKIDGVALKTTDRYSNLLASQLNNHKLKLDTRPYYVPAPCDNVTRNLAGSIKYLVYCILTFTTLSFTWATISPQLIIYSPTNQNSIHGEITSRLISHNGWYHSLQNLLYSRLLSTNIKIKIQRTLIVFVLLYGCKSWTFTLKKGHRLRVFEKRVLRIFGPKTD